MINREKIIKGLKHCINEEDCRGCAYYDDYCNQIKERHRDNKCPCFLDVIALLKEQEAKSPFLMQDEENIWFMCPKCGHKLRPFLALPNAYCPKFCSECGQKVKWVNGHNKGEYIK